MLINSSNPLLIVLCLLASFLLILSGESAAGVLAGPPLVPAIYCYLLLCGKKVFCILPAAAAFLYGFLLSKNPAGYFLYLILPLALTAVFYYSALKNFNKTGTVLRMSVVSAIWFSGLCAVFLLQRFGTISLETVTGILDGVIAQIRETILAYLLPAALEALEGAGESAALAGGVESLLDAELFSFRAVLPAMIAVYFIAQSYVTALVYGGLSRVTGSGGLLSGREWRLTASRTSAVVFAAAYLCDAFLKASHYSVFAITVRNLLQLLLPLFFVLGLKEIRRLVSGRSQRKHAALITAVLCAAALLLLGPFAVRLIALTGLCALFFHKRKSSSNGEF